jgi:hypothetical protein
MKLFSSMNHPGVWMTKLMASAILMITMGTRQSMGLYVGPLNTDTGLGIVSISLAMAIGITGDEKEDTKPTRMITTPESIANQLGDNKSQDV